jgi:hypothetical protein
VSHDKELQNWVRSLEISDIIQQHKAQVSWTFTPPKAAHFGGIYEIMVKASKRCLKVDSCQAGRVGNHDDHSESLPSWFVGGSFEHGLRGQPQRKMA